MKATILVVDDSEVDRRLIAGLLNKREEYHIEMVENGHEALQRVAMSQHDLVVTDLVMPEMNGLELLRAIQRKHPNIPVILLTACGNEMIAYEALDSGAASYVPKARQAEWLMETVDRVLKHAVTNRGRDRLARCVLDYHLRLALSNDLDLIRALVDRVQELMASIEFADVIDRVRICEALEESLLNAMYHGNLEISEQEMAEARTELDTQKFVDLVETRLRLPQCSKRKIFVTVKIDVFEVRFIIRDEGAGFKAPSVAEIDPIKSFDRGQRRGLTLIQTMMDEVKFNAIGNELTMCKRRRVPSAIHKKRRT